MAKLVLDKNPRQFLDDDLLQMQKEFSGRNPNIILCSESFVKSEFLNRLIDSANFHVIFLDFDLLYSGYVSSGMIKKNDNVKIFRSSRVSLNDDIKEVVNKISKEKILVIFDSLNGLYNMFDELESVRFLNAAIMLLSSVAKHTQSLIVVTGIARKNDSGEWILSPGGRHLISSKKSGMYNLGMSDTNLILNSINEKS